MSCSGTCWLSGGAWFQCRCGGFWMNLFQLMFPGVRSFLVSSSLELSLLPLVFSLILTVASRLLHPYCTDDKTSPFEDNGLPFWVPGVLRQRSEVVLWYLFSVQMIFRRICGGGSGLPILFLCHLRTPPFSYEL